MVLNIRIARSLEVQTAARKAREARLIAKLSPRQRALNALQGRLVRKELSFAEYTAEVALLTQKQS